MRKIARYLHLAPKTVKKYLLAPAQAPLGAVDVGFVLDAVANGLIDHLAAPVALFGHIEAQRANISELGGGELHAPPLFWSSLPGRILGESWLRLGCGFCRTLPESAELGC